MSDALSFVIAASALTLAAVGFVFRPMLRQHRRAIAVALGVALLAAPLLYLGLGSVRALDSERVVDAATAARIRSVGDVREDLVAQLARNPRDARGWVLLARLDFDQDRYADAATAYEKALANAKAAGDVDLWCEYADALALAQGGRLDGKPRDIVLQALLRDPTNRRALEMAGSAALEIGDYGQAAHYWRALLNELPQGSEEQRELDLALSRVELLAQDEHSRGELLYDTHCAACHSKQIHWRDRKLVTDWATLVAQTERWQRNNGLGWSGEEVDAVARYLARQVYRLPDVPRTRG